MGLLFRCRLLSSVVEHFHGKEGVPGSNPGGGSGGGTPRGRANVKAWDNMLSAGAA